MSENQMIYVGKNFGELELLDRVIDGLKQAKSISFSAGYPYKDLSDNVCYSLARKGFDVNTRYHEEYYEKDGKQRLGKSKITTIKAAAKSGNAKTKKPA